MSIKRTDFRARAFKRYFPTRSNRPKKRSASEIATPKKRQLSQRDRYSRAMKKAGPSSGIGVGP